MRFFKIFDFFAEPPPLTLFKQKKYSTFTGFLATLSLFTVIFIFSFSKLDSVINRSDSSIESEEKIDLSTPPINMRYRFALSLSFPDYLSLNGKRYFDFFFAIRATINKNGTLLRTKRFYKFIPCEYKHFPMFEQEDLNKMGIKNWICPNYTDDSLDFHIKGTYGDDIYKFIELGILKCSKNVNTYNNDSCATNEEINDPPGKKIYFNLIIINNLLNLDNFNKPITSYIANLQTLFNVGPSFVQKEYYIDHVEIQSDLTQSMNLLRSDTNILKESHIFYDDKYEDFTINDNQYKIDQNNNQIYASAFLRSSKKNKRFFRKYNTFQDFLEAAGSYYSIFFLMFAFINSQLTKHQLIKQIALILYDFSENVDKDKDSNSSKENPSKLKNFVHNFWQNFMCFISFFFKKRKKSFGKIKFNDVESQIKNDMDIITILMKLRKLENFKKVMLNRDQDIVLEFSKKKKFVKNLSERKIATINKIKLMDNLKLKKYDSNTTKELISIYNQAFSHLEKDSENHISQKICQLINHDFKYVEFSKKFSASQRKLPLFSTAKQVHAFPMKNLKKTF